MRADGRVAVVTGGSRGLGREICRDLVEPSAAAKAGLNALTVGLDRASGPTVRVDCVMPGMFRTGGGAAWAPA